MLSYYNPHPENKKVYDCVKRAITKATGMEYHDVQLALNRYKRITGAKVFNENKNWKPYLEKELGSVKISFPAEAGKPRMNGYSFCEKYPKGKYILRMAKHIVACIDGVIYDTWDCRHKCVYNAWQVK